MGRRGAGAESAVMDRTRTAAILTAALAALAIDVLMVTAPGAQVVTATVWAGLTVALCFGALLRVVSAAYAGAAINLTVLIALVLMSSTHTRDLAILGLQGVVAAGFVLASFPQLALRSAPRLAEARVAEPRMPASPIAV